MMSIVHDLIVTSFNDKQGIHCLKSDLSLYLEHFDNIIIVDDKSAEECFSELKKLESNRVHILQTKKNSGRPSLPRNIGLRHSRANVVTFLDIGDRMPKRYLNFLTNMKTHITTDIISGIKYTCLDPMDFIDITEDSNKPLRLLSVPNWLQYSKMFALQSGITFSKSLSKNLEYEVRYLEDWQYINRLLDRGGKLKLIKCPILYKKNGLNISTGKSRQIRRVYGITKSSYRTFLYLCLAVVKYSMEKLNRVENKMWLKSTVTETVDAEEK